MRASGYAMREKLGAAGAGRLLHLMIPLIIGKQNAAVFPEPVWAHAIKSLPASDIGIAYI